jgi:uncharacterized protein with HEPN domain
MTREYSDFLNDIVDSVHAIEEFVRGMTFENFASDRKTVYAVIRAFEVMGEAAKKIPEEVRSAHPAVPWKQMAGIRDKLVMNTLASDWRSCGKPFRKIYLLSKRQLKTSCPVDDVL